MRKCCLILLLFLCACSHLKDVQPSPSPAQLEIALQQEFERLNIDPAKVTAQVPGVADNAVFDLKAAIADPDGSGPLPPTAVELTWTERLIGDYDQNGEVNISD